jgi:hypothetical protein
MKPSSTAPVPLNLSNGHSRVSLAILSFFLLVSPAVRGQDDEQAFATKMLVQMASPDLDAQMEGLDALATSLDPRIPDACLPLLKSGGTSIRRKAARAIGSRWWQIPKERVPTFVEALKVNLKDEDSGLVNMSRRGIALLKRTYDNDMFSRSKNRRWVVYERHGKPCLIDTRNHSEELLGSDTEGKFYPAYGNEAVAPSSFWHPKKEMVAMEILIFRWPRGIWVWRHEGGLRPFHVKELADLVKPANVEIGPVVDMNVKGWTGNSLDITMSYSTTVGENFIDRTAHLRWDSTTDKLQVVSDTVDGTRKIE